MTETKIQNPEAVLRSLRTKAPMTARMVLREMTRLGISFSVLAKESGIPESTLRRHVLDELPVRPRSARLLQEWGHGVISATLMFDHGDVE